MIMVMLKVIMNSIGIGSRLVIRVVIRIMVRIVLNYSSLGWCVFGYCDMLIFVRFLWLVGRCSLLRWVCLCLL